MHHTWARVVQCLGKGCPILRQRLHSAWATAAQYLSNGCPMFEQMFGIVPPASSQFCVFAGLRRRPSRPPRSRTQRHWEAVSQSLGDSFPALGNRSPRSGGPCLSAPKPFPNAWDTVSQYLGKVFPIRGKRFPNTWETIAQNLGSGCPTLGKEGARYVGNGCRVFGQIVLDISTTVAQ